jgi:hypothetical protein
MAQKSELYMDSPLKIHKPQPQVIAWYPTLYEGLDTRVEEQFPAVTYHYDRKIRRNYDIATYVSNGRASTLETRLVDRRSKINQTPRRLIRYTGSSGN